jgi:choline kinase
MKINKAIILAAGKSKRLGALTTHLPKCLLPLGTKTILEYQIENLHSCAIHDIIVVTGFYEEKIKQTSGRSFHCVSNPDFDKTNSIYSLWLALKDINEGVVILNSDVVFHPDILTNLLKARYPDALAVCFQNGLGTEEMKVKVKNDRIVDISKSMDPKIADGENVGIVKFSSGGIKVLYKMVNDLIRDGVVNAWAPLAFQKICSSYNLYAVSTEGLPWSEIDFPEDLEKVRTEIYPSICKNLESQNRL